VVINQKWRGVMNPVVQGQMKQFAKSNSLEKMSSSDQFEIFSTFCCLNGFLGENVEAYDVHLNGTEFGLDGVAVLIQGELARDVDEARALIEGINNPSIEFHFFQAKTSEKFEYGEISKFFDAVKYFFSDELKGDSAELDEILAVKELVYEEAVTKRNPSVKCFYSTTGTYDSPKKIESLKVGFEESLTAMNIFDPSCIQTFMVGAADLQNWYRTATSANSATISFSKSLVLPHNENVEEAYIGYVDGSNLLKLFEVLDDDGEVVGINRSVFYDNVRDYNPKSPINNSIKESVKADGVQDFVFRNNGITVVTKNIDRTGDKFTLDEYQIVNGCQTSNVIFDLFMEAKLSSEGEDPFANRVLQDLNVPIKIIGSRNSEFVSSIIFSTNQQNPVKPEQFWALKPYSKSLEEYFRSLDEEERLYLERRENQYRLTSVERTRIMQANALMKATAACVLNVPHRAARDYKKILSEYGSKIFQDDQDVRVYHAVSYLHYRLEFMWRNQKISDVPKSFRYYIMNAIYSRITQGKDIFSQKKPVISKLTAEIIELAQDEQKLQAQVHGISAGMKKLLNNLGADTSEKIRDTMRSSSFAAEFKQKVS
jgi:AIPR protein